MNAPPPSDLNQSCARRQLQQQQLTLSTKELAFVFRARRPPQCLEMVRRVQIVSVLVPSRSGARRPEVLHVVDSDGQALVVKFSNEQDVVVHQQLATLNPRYTVPLLPEAQWDAQSELQLIDCFGRSASRQRPYWKVMYFVQREQPPQQPLRGALHAAMVSSVLQSLPEATRDVLEGADGDWQKDNDDDRGSNVLWVWMPGGNAPAPLVFDFDFN